MCESQIGHVELDLAIEVAYHLVEVGPIPLAIGVESREHRGEQQRDSVENSLLDVIHVSEVLELRCVVLDGSTLELVERFEDLGCVIRFRLV